MYTIVIKRNNPTFKVTAHNRIQTITHQGRRGLQGVTGPQGATGAQGPQGIPGDTGPIGPTGAQGPKGDKGDRGERGLQGLQGVQGIKGDTGNTGATGPRGPQGYTGPQGNTGPQGPQGLKGDTGLTGPAGADGAAGPAGQGVPTGGTTGQVLAKASNTNYDTHWVDQTGGPGGGGAWGDITGTLSDQTDLQSALDAKYDASNPDSYISGVSWGDIVGTLADQLDLQAALDGKANSLGADDNYVTDAEKVKLSNLSGTNTGDETTSSIKTKLGITTLSGSNTGDQDLSGYLTSATAASTYLTQANATSTYLTQSAAAAAYQPLDADLTTLAGLTATTDNFIVAVSSAWASRTPAQVRTTLGLVIGTDVQAQDDELAAIAGLTSAADRLPYFTGSGTAALATFTTFGRSLVDDANAAAAIATLGLDADLATFSLPASTTISAFGATLVDDADAATARTTLGLVIGTNVQAFNSNLSTIAGLTATTGNFIVSVSSAWASRTPAQVRTTLGLVIGTNVQAWDADLDTWATKTAPLGTVVGTTDTQTLTNKRVTPRTGTVTSSATPTINTDNVDYFSITALAANITSMTTNLSGTPTDGQKLWISIVGTATRTIAWGSSFEDGATALPTTTVGTARLDVGLIWNAATSKWRCMAQG